LGRYEKVERVAVVSGRTGGAALGLVPFRRGFFLTAANILFWILLQTLLIKRAGVEWFPVFYVMSSVAILFGAWLSSRVLRRLRSNTQGLIFTIAAFVGAAAIAATQGWIGTQTPVAIVLGYLGIGLVTNSAFLLVANDRLNVVAADAFNTEQFQRIQPMVTSVSVVSSCVAGVLLAGISESVSPTWLFSLVALFILLALPFQVRLQRLAGTTAVLPPAAGSAGDHGKLRSLFPDATLRRFLHLLGAAAALSMVFTRIFNYEFAIVTNAQFATEAQLNAFNGLYTAVSGIVLLIFVNTIQRYLFTRFGLTRNLFVPPLVVAAGVLLMCAFPVFGIVVPVILVREVIISLQQQSWSVMFEGVSDAQRLRAWSWINGPATTVGGLTGSAMLAVAASGLEQMPVATTLRILSVAALCFLIVRVAVDLRVRRTYPAVLLSSLQHGDFKTRLRTVVVMAELRFVKDRQLSALFDIVRGEAEPGALRLAALRTLAEIREPSSLRVISQLLSHNDPELRRAAVRAIAAFPFEPERLYESGFSRHALIARLREAFAAERTPEIIDAILDALVALRDPDIIPFILSCLEGGTAAVRQSALHCLRNFSDPAIIDVVKPYLKYPSVRIRAQAIAAIWRFPWERKAVLTQALDDMLKTAEQSEEYQSALYLFGRLRLSDRRDVLEHALRSPFAQTRLVSAIALLKLGDASGTAVLERAIASGSPAEAASVERLATHPNVPAPQQQLVERLIHAHHLHYPADLPVSESLRVRVHDIPRACLKALLPFYRERESGAELQKIERALSAKQAYPSVRGQVVLVGLEPLLARMTSVALLAHGYLVLEPPSKTTSARVIVIGMEGDKHLPADAYTFSERAEHLGPRSIARSHYAPGELLARIQKEHDSPK
jgi:HEAT repeat protein